MTDYHIAVELDVPEDDGVASALAAVRDAGDQGRILSGPTIMRGDELAEEGRYRVDLTTEDPAEQRARYAPPPAPVLDRAPSLGAPAVNIIIAPGADAADVQQLLDTLRAQGVNLG